MRYLAKGSVGRGSLQDRSLCLFRSRSSFSVAITITAAFAEIPIKLHVAITRRGGSGADDAMVSPTVLLDICLQGNRAADACDQPGTFVFIKLIYNVSMT